MHLVIIFYVQYFFFLFVLMFIIKKLFTSYKLCQLQIQLLADLNLKKTPQLVELVDDGNVMKLLIPQAFCLLFF